MKDKKLTIISLGAGVQSSVMSLMAAKGEITPMPDYAIFSDTQAEPDHIYEWLDWLETQLPFPLLRVTHGDLRQSIFDACNSLNEKTSRAAGVPFFTEGAQRTSILRRQCTSEYKIKPVNQKLRSLLGLAKGQKAPKGEVLVEKWIGISSDEMQRMKLPPEKWMEHRFPLIEKNMARLHCLEWMRDNGYNELPKKSSCTFCPYHDRKAWLDIKENDPKSWQDAIKVDRSIREGVHGSTQRLFLHQSGIPLEEVDLTDPAKDQGSFSFMDECEGMCGV